MRKLASAFALATCLGLPLLADDWVTAVGGKPDRQGLSGEVGPRFLPKILWHGGGNSAFGEQIVIEGGKAFVNRSSDDAVFAYDLSTGAQLWRRTLPASNGQASHVSGVHDNQLYASRSNSNLPDYFYALDVVDGSTLWRSDATVDEASFESMSFSAEGDPIVGSSTRLARFDRANGRTLWSKNRQCAGSGACGAAVSGSRVYAANFRGTGLLIDVYDASNGNLIYSGPNDVGITSSHMQVFTGPSGRVYAPFHDGSSAGALIAYSDTGMALTERWRSPIPNIPGGSFAVGPDGSVYSYDTNQNMLRLDAVTGAVRNTIGPIVSPGSFIARTAVDAAGTVFLATANFLNDGAIYKLGPDLSLVWSVSIPALSYGGPALGRDGTFMVCGSTGELRAYRDSPVAIAPIRVDARIIPGSNGNGVIEPGETFAVDPSWKNIDSANLALSGAVAAFTGPTGASYTISDISASYGTVAPGASANCFDATADCYSLNVSNPLTRPASHWDAQLTENVLGNTLRTRSLHIGKSFADVPTTSPQYKFVETIFHNNITGGCTPGNFCPNDNVNRAQMAVFLLASKHGPTWTPPPAKGTVFTDVPANSFAAAWIERMPLEGISTGCGVGLYCPTANTTRAQMSVFLLRAQGGMSYNPPACTVAPFTDVPCSSPYAAWIAELVRRNITTGCGNGKYCPDDPVTRGQMAVFLTTTFGLQLYAP